MPDKNTEKKHHFINEKIIRPRLTRLQVVRRLLFWGIGAVLFGFLAAVTFVVCREQPPVARFFGRCPHFI